MKILLSILSLLLFLSSIWLSYLSNTKEATYCIGIAIFLKLTANDTKK